MGEHFDWQIDTLSAYQLTNHFHQRLTSHSWSAVKLDCHALAHAPPRWVVDCKAVGNGEKALVYLGRIRL